MAANAIDRWREGLAFHLEPRPGKAAFAIRLALICALTLLVAEIYQTPEAALTIYVAFFLNQKERATSLILNLAFPVLLAFLIGLIFLIVIAVLDDPMARVGAMTLVSAVFLFLASASKLKPIAGILALVVAYALDVLAQAPAGEAATRALLYAWLLVGIPAAVSVLVNLAMGLSPRRLAGQAIAWRLSVAAAMLRHPQERARRRLAEAIAEGPAPIDEALHLAALERTSPQKDLAALRGAARSSTHLLAAVDVATRYSAAALPPALRLYVAQKLEAMAAILERGFYPIMIEWNPPASAPLKALAGEVLSQIRHSVLQFSDPLAPETGKPAKGGFLAADALRNPDHVRYALKTTAAAMFCYILYTLLDWPGIHTCFITIYIVSLMTAGESIEKLALRIAGCLIGAGAGLAAIVLLLPQLTSIGSLMLLVFAGALVSAYVAGSGPRIAYAGFQIAFAFFLCVVQGDGPQFDLAVARDRVVGILIGNVVAYVVFTHIYPVSVVRRIDAALARIAALLVPEPAAAAAALTGLQGDLALAHYEPARMRPSAAWLSAREAVAQKLASLQAPL
ncbi:MAG TPA: FUSC family protein, partial [Rhizomicrobium sp.]